MKKIILYIFMLMLISFSVVAVSSYRVSEGVDTEVTLLNQDPDPVSPASYVDVRFKIENYGNTAFKDGIAKIIPSGPLSIEGEEQKSIGTIRGNQLGNEGVIVKFRLRVDANAVEGTVPITFAYKSGQSENWFQKEFDINIESSTKILAIEKYNVVPERLKAGNTGQINVFLKNLADSDLKDIKITLNTDENILPIGNTNEIVLSLLKRMTSEVVSFNVIVASDVDTGLYKIPIKISYKDFKANEYSVDNDLSIIIDNEPEVLVSLDNTDIRQSNKKGTVQISISNSGVSDLKFVSYEILEADEYKILSTPFMYIGNIDSDDFENVESELFVYDTDKESINLKINLKYKDNFNKDFTVVKNIPLKLYTHQELQKYGYVQEQGGSSAFLGIIISGLLMIYWVFMFIDLMKRKKMVKYKKWLWILVMIIGLPIGALVYQLFGKGRSEA